MIDPRPGDEGRLVIYARTDPHRDTELGQLTSWNARYVFVRYTAGPSGAPTEREDLEWLSDVPVGTNYRNAIDGAPCWRIKE